MPVFDGIVVDVFDVGGVVRLLGERVFPEPALPDAALPFAAPARRTIFRWREPARELAFDGRPARREVVVTFCKCPNAMQMIRQDDDCVDPKRPTSSRHPKSVSQEIDPINEERLPTVEQVDGEKIRPAGDAPAAVVWHGEA